jgi:hypothetical protein
MFLTIGDTFLLHEAYVGLPDIYTRPMIRLDQDLRHFDAG